MKGDHSLFETGNFKHLFLFCLAPDGVYRAKKLTLLTGELLPHLFTVTLGIGFPLPDKYCRGQVSRE